MRGDGPSGGTTEAAGEPKARRHPDSVDYPSIATHRAEGVDLASYIRRSGPLAPTTALFILRSVAEALDAAHRRGYIHGHVRPRNIVLAGNGHIRLAGFRATDTAASAVDAAFIAPEQVEGRGVGPRTDVYALGCVLYACLTAQPPFAGSTDEVLSAHRQQDAPRPSELRPGLPRGVDGVVTRALAKRPQDRYATCADMISSFADCMDSPIGQVRRRPPPVERTSSGGRGALALGLATIAALSMVTMTFAAGFWDRPDTLPATPSPSPAAAPPESSRPPATAVPSPSPLPAVPSAAPSIAPPSDVPATPPTSLPVASIGDASVQGGGTSVFLEFVVTISQPAAVPVTVEYETQDGSAVAGADYTASTGTVDIRPGDTSAVIRVPVLANTVGEADESLTLQLQSAANAALGSGRATGTIRAAPPNRAPTCQPKAVSVPAGGSNQFSANCTDADGNPLRYEIVTQGTRGDARVRAGKLRYEAHSSASGTDAFTYQASDGQLTSEPATVTVTITGAPQPNRSPVCENRSMSVPAGGSETVRPTCSDPDGDPLTFQIVAQGVNGTASVTDRGRLQYTANPGASGDDSFTYRASDGALQSGTATVNVSIGAPSAHRADDDRLARAPATMAVTASRM